MNLDLFQSSFLLSQSDELKEFHHQSDLVFDQDLQNHRPISNLSTTTLSIILDNATTILEMEESSFYNVLGILVPVFYTMIALLGFVGNLMVIAVVISNRQMRNTTNLLIISLAVADLLFIIICVPFTAIMYAIPVWPFGSAFCKIYQYAIHVTAYVSVYTLVLMSLDRYMAVVHPIASMTLRNQRNTLIAIGTAVGLILLLNVPTLKDFGLFTFEGELGENHSTCIHLGTVSNEHWTAFIFYLTYSQSIWIIERPFRHQKDDVIDVPTASENLFQQVNHIMQEKRSFFAFGYAVPLGLVILLYGLMLYRLLYGMPRTGSGRQSAESARSKRRVTRLCVVVVSVFAICWLPLQVVFVKQFVIGLSGDEDDNLLIIVKVVSCCLAYMNSCINPILYAFLSETFRKSFRKLLCRQEKDKFQIQSRVQSSPLEPSRWIRVDRAKMEGMGEGGPLMASKGDLAGEEMEGEGGRVPPK